MLQQIIDLQNEAIDKVVSCLKTQDEVTFKSPTGSGKTHMMACIMNKMIGDKTIFIVSSLSKSGLAKQNHDAFVSKTNTLRNLIPFYIESETSSQEDIYINPNCNVYSLGRDLYKEKSKLARGAFKKFLNEITKVQHKKIILVKDECHQATNNLDKLREEYFSKVLNLSATPKFKPDVEITKQDAIVNKLIKNFESHDASDTGKSFDQAFEKFINLKANYIRGVNPCMIIQISNEKEGWQEWLEIKKKIENKCKWMLITGKDKECDTNDKCRDLPVSKWKDYAKHLESEIDVIVFKMVITEGWDIPRACMLYQIRDSSSKTLDEQVVGRVLRNPILTRWDEYTPIEQNLALQAWVWGIIPKELRMFQRVELQDKTIKVKTTGLKDISEKLDFLLKDFIKARGNSISITDSIFKLWEKWNSVSNSTRELCWKNIKTIEEWFKISEMIDEIDRENNRYKTNYEKSMFIDGTEEMSNDSFYEIYSNNKQHAEINEWIWKQPDHKNDYCFDSEAEAEFAEILKELEFPTWGRNFYANSKIHFKYMSTMDENGKLHDHDSFPDFILKDSRGRIHIFEVKSFNQSNSFFFDENEYKEKIKSLQECYLWASKKTEQIFYIPVKKGNTWTIFSYKNGIEYQRTRANLILFINED